MAVQGTIVDLLPAELMVHIAHHLTSSGRLALSATCQRFNAALHAEIAPIRLAQRLQWIVTPSGVRSLMQRLRLVRPESRRVLLLRLGEQLSVLHPDLSAQSKADVQSALNALPAATGTMGNGLWGILALAPEKRAEPLAQWLHTVEWNKVMPLQSWLDLIRDQLPPAGRGRVLAVIASELDSHATTDAYLARHEAMLRATRELVEPDDSPCVAQGPILAELAYQLIASEEETPDVAAHWDELMDLAVALPPAAQKPLMLCLSGGIRRAFMMDPRHAGAPPRWRTFCDTAAALEPDVGTVALAALVSDPILREMEELDDVVALFDHVMAIATRMPEGPCAAVLAAAIRAFPDGDRLPPRWEAIWHACAAVNGQPLAEVLCGLADSIAVYPAIGDTPQQQWLALQSRARSLPPPLRLKPLMALAACKVEKFAAAACAALAEASSGLSPAEQIRLAIQMARSPLATVDAGWRYIVAMIQALPVAWRFQCVDALFSKLLAQSEWDDDAPSSHLSPDGLLCAARPADYAGMLRALSEMMTWLPLRDRVGLLLNMAVRMEPRAPWQQPAALPWHSEGIVWAIAELGKLSGPTLHGRQDALIVTVLACAAAKQCRTASAAQALFEPLLAAIMALPNDTRASALLYLKTLCKRLSAEKTSAALERFGQAWMTLPEGDVPAPKRKANTANGSARGETSGDRSGPGHNTPQDKRARR